MQNAEKIFLEKWKIKKHRVCSALNFMVAALFSGANFIESASGFEPFPLLMIIGLTQIG